MCKTKGIVLVMALLFLAKIQAAEWECKINSSQLIDMLEVNNIGPTAVITRDRPSSNISEVFGLYPKYHLSVNADLETLENVYVSESDRLSMMFGFKASMKHEFKLKLDSSISNPQEFNFKFEAENLPWEGYDSFNANYRLKEASYTGSHILDIGPFQNDMSMNLIVHENSRPQGIEQNEIKLIPQSWKVSFNPVPPFDLPGYAKNEHLVGKADLEIYAKEVLINSSSVNGDAPTIMGTPFLLGKIGCERNPVPLSFRVDSEINFGNIATNHISKIVKPLNVEVISGDNPTVAIMKVKFVANNIKDDKMLLGGALVAISDEVGSIIPFNQDVELTSSRISKFNVILDPSGSVAGDATAEMTVMLIID